MSVSNLFMNARKTYQHLFPGISLQHRRQSSLRRYKHEVHSELTTLDDPLGSLQPVPSHTILLGQCMDGLPFLMGLGDPDIGAILISCEVGCGRTRQLQTMVNSAIRTHFPHELQIAILTTDPAEWDFLQALPKNRKYLHSIHAWKENQTEEVIKQITELAEARRQGQRQGVDVLLFLDDFDSVEELSYETQVNLHWLLEYGSQSGVWIIGTLKADLAKGFRYWVNTFRTRIVGRVQQPEDADILAMKPGSQATNLVSGAFKVWTGNSWLTYSLLPLGE